MSKKKNPKWLDTEKRASALTKALDSVPVDAAATPQQTQKILNRAAEFYRFISDK